ncbi:MAG: hypothetical protein J3K34DRAFT_420760 [Monoraphidium minutum]|nr:MAG: hypothetical protein J3K34DRAFT_420760 [Monoraphidium minutum]
MSPVFFCMLAGFTPILAARELKYLSSGMKMVSASLGLESVAPSFRLPTICLPYSVLGVASSAAMKDGKAAAPSAAGAPARSTAPTTQR